MTSSPDSSPRAEHYFGEHIREQQQRWESVLAGTGHDAVLVHAGTPMYSFLDDYEYAFRPNPHFLSWLPLTHHPDSALLVRPGERPVLYFYQPNDYWYLPPADPASWWADHFDIRVMRDADGWQAEVAGALPPQTAAIGDSGSLTAVFPAERLNPEKLVTALHLQRTRKTPYEIECMAKASRLAAGAHRAAEAAFRIGGSELEIHQAYLAACGHVDARLPYGNIVALNEHGAVLHYQGRDANTPKVSRSFLIDAGCTYQAYCSDITRTYSQTSGPFADLIVAMDELQQEIVSKVRAGLDYRALHLSAHQGIAGILCDAGVILTDAGQAVESGLSSVFYPHGLGHFIGLQTHDVAGLIDDEGQPIPRPEGHPFLRLTRTLEPGNVLTIEPGLYFIPALLDGWKKQGDPALVNWAQIDELIPFGGIRIEDNIVVGEKVNRNLTREAFAAL